MDSKSRLAPMAGAICTKCKRSAGFHKESLQPNQNESICNNCGAINNPDSKQPWFPRLYKRFELQGSQNLSETVDQTNLDKNNLVLH